MEPSSGIQDETAPLGLSGVTVEEAREALASAPGLPFTSCVIPSSVHGLFDYLLGFGAIAAPLLFGLASPVARLVVPIQGATVLIYSLLTNYEWGAIRIIPFRTHLLLDVLGGSFLLAAPRVFGFRRRAGLFRAIALVELAITLLTCRQSGTERWD